MWQSSNEAIVSASSQHYSTGVDADENHMVGAAVGFENLVGYAPDDTPDVIAAHNLRQVVPSRPRWTVFKGVPTTITGCGRDPYRG